MKRAWRFVPWLLWGLLPLTAGAEVPEVIFPAERRKLLEQYEDFQLQKADKSYLVNNFRLAEKEYDKFLLEFPKSAAIPYVLARKARCMQRDNRKYEAIKQLKELLDYFPDDVVFATAALYYQGTCYWDMLDPANAIKALVRSEDIEEPDALPLVHRDAWSLLA